jgi:hypothetical protein
MLHRFITATTIAVSTLVALGAVEQSNTQPRATSPPQASETVQPTLTLVGCLYREEQVSGRTPNVAERAGILEDYILADAMAPTAGSAAGGAVGTSGATPVTGNMYKVAKISDDKLKALVGRRVEATGRIKPEGSPARPSGAQRDRSLSQDLIDLPELEASAIREVPGTCPATPAPLR